MKRRLFIIGLIALLALSFSALAGGEGIAAFGQVIDPGAEQIDLGAYQVQSMEELTRALDQLPALKQVDMFESRVSAEEMDYLADRYPEIFFGWTIRIKEHTIRTDQTAFSTLHNNRSPSTPAGILSPSNTAKTEGPGPGPQRHHGH